MNIWIFSEGVLAELPDRINLRRGLGRTRLANIPTNPQRLQDFEEVPVEYKVQLVVTIY